jgi:hypothetical protein
MDEITFNFFYSFFNLEHSFIHIKWRGPTLLLSSFHMCCWYGEHSEGIQRLSRHHSENASASIWVTVIFNIKLSKLCTFSNKFLMRFNGKPVTVHCVLSKSVQYYTSFIYTQAILFLGITLTPKGVFVLFSEKIVRFL